MSTNYLGNVDFCSYISGVPEGYRYSKKIPFARESLLRLKDPLDFPGRFKDFICGL